MWKISVSRFQSPIQAPKGLWKKCELHGEKCGESFEKRSW